VHRRARETPAGVAVSSAEVSMRMARREWVPALSCKEPKLTRLPGVSAARPARSGGQLPGGPSKFPRAGASRLARRRGPQPHPPVGGIPVDVEPHRDLGRSPGFTRIASAGGKCFAILVSTAPHPPGDAKQPTPPSGCSKGPRPHSAAGSFHVGRTPPFRERRDDAAANARPVPGIRRAFSWVAAGRSRTNADAHHATRR
jgi:hypothetical protein